MKHYAVIEVNFDGLVGPTHNYAGLAPGNTASMRHGGLGSSPRNAALEALAKMKLLMDMGIPQAVLPPHERPDIVMLRRVGFTGSDAQVLADAARLAPRLLAAASSASSMWAANAATVSPSPDTADGRLHITPANLLHNLHRSIEPPTTTLALRAIFADESRFVIHDPLPATLALSDEGAANHTRLCGDHGSPGVELFVYGHEGLDDPAAAARFPRRQSRLASEAIARLHQLDPSRTRFARQHSEAIDAGVFHNDVIAVGHRNIFLCHERAFADQRSVLDNLRQCCASATGGELHVIEIPESLLSLDDAVRSYFFNSQLVTTPEGVTTLIAPAECGDIPSASAALEHVTSRTGPIHAYRLVDVRQSMRNGGGPACLRLRVAMTSEEQRAAHQGVFLNPTLHASLVSWVERHYRGELLPEDLAAPALLRESRDALDALTGLLGLGALYPFQRA